MYCLILFVPQYDMSKLNFIHFSAAKRLVTALQVYCFTIQRRFQYEFLNRLNPLSNRSIVCDCNNGLRIDFQNKLYKIILHQEQKNSQCFGSVYQQKYNMSWPGILLFMQQGTEVIYIQPLIVVVYKFTLIYLNFGISCQFRDAASDLPALSTKTNTVIVPLFKSSPILLLGVKH